MGDGPLGEKCEVPFSLRAVRLKVSTDKSVPVNVWVTPVGELGLHEVEWETNDGTVIGTTWGVCHVRSSLALRQDFITVCQACTYLRFFEPRVDWRFTEAESPEGLKAKAEYQVALIEYRGGLPSAEAC